MAEGSSILKRIGIYFFCVIAIGCVTSSILYWENEKSGEISVERTSENSLRQSSFEEEAAYEVSENLLPLSEEIILESNNDEKGKFLVRNEDGYLVIYDCETGKRYDETAILVSHLPEIWQKKIEEGLYFVNEEALYEFLENYSS